eukprot:1148251-Pelagomonas_calceolata.AAC.16
MHHACLQCLNAGGVQGLRTTITCCCVSLAMNSGSNTLAVYTSCTMCTLSAQMLEMYKEFCTKYPVISIEDPFEQDDWEPAKSLTAENICQVRAGLTGLTSPVEMWTLAAQD